MKKLIIAAVIFSLSQTAWAYLSIALPSDTELQTPSPLLPAPQASAPRPAVAPQSTAVAKPAPTPAQTTSSQTKFNSPWLKFISTLHPLITLSGGGAWANAVDADQNLALSAENVTLQNVYVEQNAHALQPMYGGLIGLETSPFPIAQHDFITQLGVSFYQINPFSTQGVMVKSLPFFVFPPANYQYRVQSQQLLLESKFLMPLAKRWYPYLNVGLGTAFNRAYAYQEQGFAAPFPDHTDVNFSYEVGAGLEAMVVPHLRLGVNYRFAALGPAELGVLNGGTLRQSQLNAQILLLQASYIF